MGGERNGGNRNCLRSLNDSEWLRNQTARRREMARFSKRSASTLFMTLVSCLPDLERASTLAPDHFSPSFGYTSRNHHTDLNLAGEPVKTRVVPSVSHSLFSNRGPVVLEGTGRLQTKSDVAPACLKCPRYEPVVKSIAGT